MSCIEERWNQRKRLMERHQERTSTKNTITFIARKNRTATTYPLHTGTTISINSMYGVQGKVLK